MTRAFKTWMVWLLLAVLPLQAVAGSRLSCAQFAAQSSEGSIAAIAQQHEAHEAHEALVQAHDHHGGEHAMSADAAPSDGHAKDGHAAKKSHSPCSACSVFCLGAAAPPSVHLSVPAFDGSNAVVVAPAVFAVGFIQDGPQRPPRHQSA